jgi:hypothetical protein
MAQVRIHSPNFSVGKDIQRIHTPGRTPSGRFCYPTTSPRSSLGIANPWMLSPTTQQVARQPAPREETSRNFTCKPYTGIRPITFPRGRPYYSTRSIPSLPYAIRKRERTNLCEHPYENESGRIFRRVSVRLRGAESYTLSAETSIFSTSEPITTVTLWLH